MDEARALRQLKALKRLTDDSIQLAAEEWSEEWQTLISTMLSARTRDEVTIVVATALFKKYNSVKKLAHASLKDIEKMIYSVNFYRNKAKNVLACAKMLDREYHGIVPHDFDKLILLPGVGRKTANVFLSEMGKQAIGVDTHVYYISRYLGWSRQKDPHKVESDLKKLFSKKNWNPVNPVLVRFGKTHMSRKKKDALLDTIKKIK